MHQWFTTLIFLMCIYVAISTKNCWLADDMDFTSQNGGFQLNGKQILLKGISWFGFETSMRVFHGFQAQKWSWFFDVLQNNSFNAMRIPISLEMVTEDKYPDNIEANPDLKNLTSMQILDMMINESAHRGITILLDLHSFHPDGAGGDGLWYDANHPEEMVTKMWKTLQTRYVKSWNVIAMDVKNEPWKATWGKGDNTTDFNKAVERIGNALHSAGSNWLVFAEGTGDFPPTNCTYWDSSGHKGDACFWGEDVLGAHNYPIKLNKPNKLVYSPHVYGPSVYDQGYFHDPNFPLNMPAIWDEHFGFIKDFSGPAVSVGEWGGYMDGQSGIWMNAFVDYLVKKKMTDTYFWALNCDSHDTGGLLLSWNKVDPARAALLNRLVPHPTHFIEQLSGHICIS